MKGKLINAFKKVNEVLVDFWGYIAAMAFILKAFEHTDKPVHPLTYFAIYVAVQKFVAICIKYKII
ncbi:hypothetical protein [Enterobacter sp. RIT418]|uniref:hypothetical protein n=1 Tax=Enterobacter sp. RIT418 TaxID=2202164 RepID=UPI000D4F0805|nr:hypothetical protein [Enterobacter sp. RIT 418]RAU31695.1 hypothetical protein DBY73_018485 [Enterobacter sp. RIT 418]